ncbi:hypothetical protein [Mycolicibacterium wolinskyi]|uniref:hypothetical protein n=1 Tax=Mycolicibacterium wolinskyi TaxID=59750 RepID=UPI0039176BAF
MAKPAIAPLGLPADSRTPYIRRPDESDMAAEARNMLMDIGVDDTERDALLDSRCKGRIQIESKLRREEVLDSFLDFLSRHALGRGMLSSLLDDGTIVMTFCVADTSEESEQLVHAFAKDVARILGLAETDIAEATVIEVDDDRLRRALAALGVRRPDLKPV